MSKRHMTAVAGKVYASPDAADAATDGVTYLPAGAKRAVELSFPKGRSNETTVLFDVKRRGEVHSPTVVRVATTQTLDVGQIKVDKDMFVWVGVAISGEVDDQDSSNGRASKDRADAIYERQAAVVVPNRPGVYRVAAILDDERVVTFRVEVAEALADPEFADRQISAVGKDASGVRLSMGGVPIVPASPRIDRRAT